MVVICRGVLPVRRALIARGPIASSVACRNRPWSPAPLARRFRVLRAVMPTLDEADADVTDADNGVCVAAGEGGHWKKAIDSGPPLLRLTVCVTCAAAVAAACVVLRVTGTRAFDTESPGSSYATGFVVDKSRGLILTNRHVVKPGPVTAEAVFLNREEVSVLALYRDPVHDFAFFRYDPAAVSFMAVEEVPLSPSAAIVGLDVRVIGNDSGEKLSILQGTLARLDRDTPSYDKSGYNDSNTFYLQAASGTKGGSSGSPVVDIFGRAVAMNAGSKTKTNSAFFLPLERVVRALGMLQRCCPEPGAVWLPPAIPRGTFQVIFAFKGFDEARRLGLSTALEAACRAAGGPGATGVLTVDQVIRGGPADGLLNPGDLILAVNGHSTAVPNAAFLVLEEALDDNVNGTVSLSVERGGEALHLVAPVQDLEAVCPSSFLEVAGASLHALSLQQARNFATPVGSVYVASAGYSLAKAAVPKHAIIKSLAGRATPALEAFAATLRELPQDARVPLEYITFDDRHRVKTTLYTVDRQWSGPPVYYTRNDATSVWDRTTAYPPLSYASLLPMAPTAPPVVTATPPAVPNAGAAPPPLSAVALPPGPVHVDDRVAESVAAILSPSLVALDVDVPPVALADGVHVKHFRGTGLVVHHDPASGVGLVLCDRNTARRVMSVPIASCDVMLTFVAFPCEVQAKVRFLHPIHNFGLISYNPADLPAAALAVVAPATLLPDPAIATGERVLLVTLALSMRTVSRASTVTDARMAVSVPQAEVPRFRETNCEAVELDVDLGTALVGALVDGACRVRALWANFAKQVKGEEREFVAGLHAHAFAAHVAAFSTAPWRHDAGMAVAVLDAELEALPLARAGALGLPASWVAALAALDPARRQVLRVVGCLAGGGCESLLSSGDMILRADGGTCVSFRDVEAACDARAAAGHTTLGLSIWRGGATDRGGAQIEVEATLTIENGRGTARLLHWAGLQLQSTHRGVRELGYLPPGHTPPPNGGVFISRWHHGSPAHRFAIYALNWITEVNGSPVADLDAFIAATRGLQHLQPVRLKLVALNSKPRVVTLKLDLIYWPAWTLERGPDDTWARHDLD